MTTSTGPGYYERLKSPAGALLLYNFDIDGIHPKPAHRDALRVEAVPMLKQGGSVTIIGLASRSGAAQHNQSLSEKRARNVFALLRQLVGEPFPALAVMTGYGEWQAAREGYRDRTEDPRFRAVVVSLSPSPKPPSPNEMPDFDFIKDIDLPPSYLELSNQILDGIGVTHYVGFFLEGAAEFALSTVGLAAL